ncbi:MAG: TRM11 family SAM-dependent methyltransferase [Microcoleus sp.]
MTICLLGRQPKLGLAELEAVFGAEHIHPVGDIACEVDDEVDLSRFGGLLKVAKHLTTLETIEFPKLISYVRKTIPDHLQYIPEGKIKLGLSFYGYELGLPKLNAANLSVKKTIKQAGRSVRVVPNIELALSTAQVMHNQLTSPVGIEFLFVRDGSKTILAQTTAVQNIEDYKLRDLGRPKRDAFVGMLPPKLAQTMLNLAQAKPGTIVFDPFCGTGVVLQEAALLGAHIYGSDLMQRMVDYSEANLDWLRHTYDLNFDSTLETADATSHRWETPFDSVVSETYLGQPMSNLPPPEKLRSIIAGCDDLHHAFFKNLAPQLKSGTRLCIALPAWRTPKGFLHLSTLDDLENLGYNRVDFVNATQQDLIYHREDQIVARELLILTRK